MNRRRIGVVAAHPAHVLAVLGLVARHRAQVLVVTRSDDGQEALLRTALAMIGLDDRVTALGMDETDSYRRVLGGDFGLHRDAVGRIAGWLEAIGAEAVYGDAFELSNYHHDLVRVMLDAAVEQRRSSRQDIGNYEFPLSYRPDRPGAPVVYGRFADGQTETLRLTAREAEIKQGVLDWAVGASPLVAEVTPGFTPLDTERFRPVPLGRCYRAAPPGLARHYEEHGREAVAAGRYRRLITFEEHFVPAVQAIAASAEFASA